MNKKSQGLSVNTIIIAAIALIVLVVLIAIFTGRFGGFSEGIQETEKFDLEKCPNSCKGLDHAGGNWLVENVVGRDCSDASAGYNTRHYGLPRTLDGDNYMICCCQPKTTK